MFVDECDLSPPDRGWNYEPTRAELLQKISAPLYTTDVEGWLTYYNDAAAELWGRHPVLGEERWCGSWRIYDTDGKLLPREQWPLAVAFQQSCTVYGRQAILEQPDGTRVPVMPHPTLLRDRSGTVIAGSSILLKITRSLALRGQFSAPLGRELGGNTRA
ncbi:PAS domain-containing protein [Methylorubrum rhodesianum]|uniref:hypothetical protein n=1 Tax=Methylorubrum TaxID=2282523 RepID=UPI00161634F6|nr:MULTISPECIES: hypothetical protein [Methylorubrum]MBB5765794.1 PAS domain-containing protein [Methylorubrum rhodesianum]MBI1692128.1 hypothetical protein [Methylorubrum sp. DB1722]